MIWPAIRAALLLLALAPFAYYIAALIAARKFFRRRTEPPPDFTPPVSILKPIFGLDREAYENFASFCRQDYPEFEVVFCVSDREDPAVPVIEKLIVGFPARAIRLLVGAEPVGASDKMNKLCRMAREAKHQILVVSDSDVRVEPGFLRAVVAPFRDPQVGGVTCLYRGLTDGSRAADLEAIGNSTDFAAGVLVARMLGGMKFMLGAIMATTKERLREIGGFESIADYFADDYELGNRIAARGARVELTTFPVSIVYPHETLGDAFRHQLRWNLSIRTSRPGGHFGMIFTHGIAWAALGMILAPTALTAFLYAAGYLLLSSEVLRTVGVWGMQDSNLWRKQYLLPVRDAFAFVVWLASFFPQRIHWRGREFFVRESKLVAVGGERNVRKASLSK
jgi:ceramide glucosyltransferase